jgi:hypothetical protein
MLARAEQLWKAPSPILTTLDGINRVVRDKQEEKA